MPSCVWSNTANSHPAYNLAPASSCMAPQSGVPNFMNLAQHGGNPPHHTTHTPPHPASSGAAAMAATMGGHQGIEPYQETERRSSSIAALRLKAREHSVSLGILSAYGK